MSNEIIETTEEDLPTSYSSSTPAAATNRKAITAPGMMYLLALMVAEHLVKLAHFV